MLGQVDGDEGQLDLVAAQLAELEKELDSESLRTQLIVSLGSASRIRSGGEAELFVDARKMHLFEPGSGANLTVVPADSPA